MADRPPRPRGPARAAEARRHEDRVDFGFEAVPASEKSARVAGVFDSVAERYDLMNDLMSFGLHRLWKRFAVAASRVRPGARVLDLAGGTGDLTARLARRVGPSGEVVLSDINRAMMQAGRRALVDRGLVRTVRYVQADAESLPFPDRHFDAVLIGFGLRNVTRKARALAESHRVLRPGGQMLILEFSRVRVPALVPIYDRYSFRVLPWLGKVVAGDAQSYRYLAESIRMHPDQEALQAMMEAAGFERCGHHNLAAGVVALHRGYRL